METIRFEDPSNIVSSQEAPTRTAASALDQEFQNSNLTVPDRLQDVETSNLLTFFHQLGGQTFDDALDTFELQSEMDEDPSESDIISGPEFEGEEEPWESGIIYGPEWPAPDEPFEDLDGGDEVEPETNDSTEGPQMSVAAADPIAYREQANFAFRMAMVAQGLVVPSTLQADGRNHRCDVQGAGGEGDGSYRLCLDAIPSGGFQNWKDGHGWQAWSFEFGPGTLISPEKQNEMRKNAEALRKVRAAEEAEARKRAQEIAQAIWRRSLPCTEHPYLTSKGINPHGARLVSSGLRKGELVIPVVDSRGVIHSIQTIDVDGGKHFLKNGRKQGCCFPIGKPKTTLFIAEGFATAASIHEATGEAVLVAFDCGNLRPVAEALLAAYPDYPIVVAADDDYRTDGNPGLTKAIEAAEAVCGKVAVPDFGIELERPEKATDFNDMAQQQGLEAVRVCIEIALEVPDPCSGPKPIIWVHPPECDVVNEVLVSLSREKCVFEWGCQLAHISTPLPAADQRNSPRPAIILANAAWIRWEMSRVVEFRVRIKKGEYKQILVPEWLPKMTLEKSDFHGMPKLLGLAETPLLLENGTIHDKPGLDPSTGIFFVPLGDVPAIADEPSREDAEAAAAALFNLVSDFPFANEPSKAAWLALLLTIPARFAIPGPVPFWLIDANGQSAGKGLLTHITSIITLGRNPVAMVGSRDPEEFRKNLLSTLMEGRRLGWLDEAESPFGGGRWNGLMTFTTYSDRILCTQRNWDGPHFTVWVVSGNNVQLTSDTSRRCVHVRLEPPEERPEERGGFKITDILAYTRQHRAELLNHVLVILRAYHLAGRPKHDLKPWGSFEDWSNLVREAVYWCTGIDCDTRRELTATADPVREMSGVILEQLERLFPGGQNFLASEVMAAHEAKGMDGRWANPDLHEALETLNTNPRGLNSKSLGNLLKTRKDRNFNGLVLKGNPGGKQGMTYRIVRVSGEMSPVGTRTPELPLPIGPMPDFPGLRGWLPPTIPTSKPEAVPVAPISGAAGGSGGSVLPTFEVMFPAGADDVAGGLEGGNVFGGNISQSVGAGGARGSGAFTVLSSGEGLL